MVNTDVILKDVRDELDALDDRILDLFAERYRLRDKAMALKMQHGLPVKVPSRMEAIFKRLEARAEARGVPPEFVRALYAVVFDFSHKCEEELRSRKAS